MEAEWQTCSYSPVKVFKYSSIPRLIEGDLGIRKGRNGLGCACAHFGKCTFRESGDVLGYHLQLPEHLLHALRIVEHCIIYHAEPQREQPLGIRLLFQVHIPVTPRCFQCAPLHITRIEETHLEEGYQRFCISTVLAKFSHQLVEWNLN